MDDSKQYIGDTFDGRYKIERLVGIGGMAYVYEAKDLRYGKTVAVKLLKDKFSDDSRAVKRFINESKSLEILNHPNIVKIYDISVSSPNKFIVMEYINGITLRKYMNYKLPLEWTEASDFAEQILLALDHAHTKGIVHRDIKPQNIMIMQGGAVRVTDFGIAKIPKSEALTLVDKAIGTVYYISPEQASSRKIDARSDIYSLGVMLYEMVTGKLPFTADTPIAVIFKHINDSPVPPSKLNPAIPRGLEQIILCAMEKNPQNRYQSAAQMLRHLRRLRMDPATVFLQQRPVPKTSTSETTIRRTSRPHRDTSEFDFSIHEHAAQARKQSAPAQQPRAQVQPQRQQVQPQRQQAQPQRQQAQPQRQQVQPQRQQAQPQRQQAQQRSHGDKIYNRSPNVGIQMPGQRSNQYINRAPSAQQRQAPKNGGSPNQRASRPNQNNRQRQAQGIDLSTYLPFAIIILLIAIVCTILISVAISNVSEAATVPFQYIGEDVQAKTLLLYLKQVIL